MVFEVFNLRFLRARFDVWFGGFECLGLRNQAICAGILGQVIPYMVATQVCVAKMTSVQGMTPSWSTSLPNRQQLAVMCGQAVPGGTDGSFNRQRRAFLSEGLQQ